MKEQIKELIIKNVNAWQDPDIYVISLFVYDDCDNPCKPTVTLGYNTESQVQYELHNGSVTDEEEARWNYAFWLQNQFFVFGEDETAEIVKNWVIANGFPYHEDNYCFDDETIEKASEITKSFVSILVDAVREIHEQGILTQKFGRELPIIIHELEYYDEIAEQNMKANGENLVKNFAEWCMYG